MSAKLVTQESLFLTHLGLCEPGKVTLVIKLIQLARAARLALEILLHAVFFIRDTVKFRQYLSLYYFINLPYGCPLFVPYIFGNFT